MSVLARKETARQKEEIEKKGVNSDLEQRMIEEELILEEITVDCICGVY